MVNISTGYWNKKREKRKKKKTGCPTLEKHIRRQADLWKLKQILITWEEHLFVWVSNSHLMLACSSWSLDMNLNRISRYQFGKKPQCKIGLASPCLLQVNMPAKRSSLKLPAYFSFVVPNLCSPPAPTPLVFLAGACLWTTWPSPAPDPSSPREAKDPGHAPHSPAQELLVMKCKRRFPFSRAKFSLLIRRKISQLHHYIIKSCN